jgi:hypothetical protein
MRSFGQKSPPKQSNLEQLNDLFHVLSALDMQKMSASHLQISAPHANSKMAKHKLDHQQHIACFARQSALYCQ